MEALKISLAILFHPVDSFNFIKRDRSKFNYIPVFILMFLVVAVRIASIFLTHFPMSNLRASETDIWMEVFRFIVPLLTWTIACYAVTTILDGETLLRETLAAAAYAMLPYIVLIIPLSIASHMMEGKGDKGLFVNLNNIIWIWVAILIFISVQSLNGYSFVKTVGICTLSIITMAIIWSIVALFFAMSSQFYQFLVEVILEIRLLLMH